MSNSRVTVSLDADAQSALDSLTKRTGLGQGELSRRALTFYAANFQAATTDASANLGDMVTVKVEEGKFVNENVIPASDLV